MTDVAVGTVVAGHRLLEKIGEGYYGEVWKADYLGHTVAFKRFTRTGRRAHLRREAFAQYALGRLGGPDGEHFPHVEHIELDQEPFYVRMEYVEGRPLEDLLADGARPLDARLSLGLGILEALEVAHRHGFVHGDLSPRNILVTPEGRIKLIDVGYGALFDEEARDITTSGEEGDRSLGVASPLYAAPERFTSEFLAGCGKPSDLFAFGKILYRLVTGESPFVVKPVSMKFPALGRAWDDFIFRCLEEDPAKRFADGGAALAEYRRLFRPEPAPGEYRAGCPECGARMSVPGGWAGERFPCHGCSRTLEVLFYDEATHHASTAAVAAGAPDAGIEFVEDGGPDLVITDGPDSRLRKFCPACGRSIYAEAKKCRHCRAWVDDVARRLMREEAGRRRTSAGAAPLWIVYVAITLAALFVAAFLGKNVLRLW